MNEQEQLSEYPSEEIVLEVIKDMSENKTEIARLIKYIEKNLHEPEFDPKPQSPHRLAMEKRMMNDERIHHLIIELQEEMEKL